MLDEELLALNESWMELQAELATRTEVLLCLTAGPYRAGLVERAKETDLQLSLAATADEAVSILEKDTTDLLIVSDTLPDMSGLDLVRWVRGRPTTPEVIVLAQNPSPRKVVDVIQLGVSDYLLEPEQGAEEVLARANRRVQILNRHKLQQRMLRDLRQLHRQAPPEEYTQLVTELKDNLDQYQQSLGPMNKVLIVDPDALVRLQLGSALGGLGFIPSEALDGTSALFMLQEEGADLVVVAADLPDVAISEIIKRIAQTSNSLPAVLLSNVGDLEVTLSAMQAGVADCIRKPIASPVHAAHRIVRVLKERRRELLAENLIGHLYRLVRQASETIKPDAAAKVDGVFDEMIVVLPPEDARLVGGLDPTGEVEVEDARDPKDSLRLTSGELEFVRQGSDADILSHDALPDTVVIEYIDKLISTGDKPPSKMGAGRRLTPRVERSIFVRYGPTGTEQASLGFAQDLSLGGIFILSEDPPSLGTDLQLELQIPDLERVERIRLQGRVVWLTDPKGINPHGFGFGVQFTVMNPQASAALLRAVTE